MSEQAWEEYQRQNPGDGTERKRGFLAGYQAGAAASPSVDRDHEDLQVLRGLADRMAGALRLGASRIEELEEDNATLTLEVQSRMAGDEA